MPDPRSPIRVLLVDDSPTIRMVLADIVGSQPDMEICGQCANGAEAIERTRTLNPSVVVMDIEMPVLDGFQATERIMALSPRPILILSSVLNRSEVYTTLRAIELGALDAMAKPEFEAEGRLEAFARDLLGRIRVLSRVQVITHIRGAHAARRPPPSAPPPGGSAAVIGIGASTGGPLVLKTLLRGLPAGFPVPVTVVQHITTGFMEGMVDWLNAECTLRVTVAQARQIMLPGHAYFIPNGTQPVFPDARTLALDDQLPAVNGFKPAADTLFEALAERFSDKAIGLLLTGMGTDGAAGLLRLKQTGGLTVAQERSSCIVYGMPRAAVERGAALHLMTPEEMAAFLTRHVKAPRTS